MAIDWNNQLAEQLDWHWRVQPRPRLDGLTDDEYRWEPVPGAWNVRPRGTSSAPISVGAGEFTIDFAMPQPDPPPVTTIAWRIGHIVVGVLGMRVASHFGGLPFDYTTHEYPGDAATAMAQLDECYAGWIKGVRGLGADGLARPCGPAEGPWADEPMAALVLHINREMLHHAAEPEKLAQFWALALGYITQPLPEGFTSLEEFFRSIGISEEEFGDQWALIDPAGYGPRLYFQRVPEGKTAKNRVHLDVRVAGLDVTSEERERLVSEHVSRLAAAGGTVAWELDEAHGRCTVMRDPEGNEFCIA